MHASAEHHRSHDHPARAVDYVPLAIIIVFTVLTAAAMQANPRYMTGPREWMLDAMGIFLVLFAMFKCFDLSGFADGFQMYDLLAQRLRAYALVYPFIELGLGLGYLARVQPALVYGLTLVVMTFGALGVIRALRRKLDVDCACLGTVLRVPLSTVALAEDVGMAAMAALLLTGLSD
jgi:hypothetical protein